MKKLIGEFLCAIGIHNNKKEKRTIWGTAGDNLEYRAIDLYYDICQRCGEGDPRKTGEW